jgi:endogenous inhibitor of DNA gyrase (YacG/DUF329 family)
LTRASAAAPWQIEHLVRLTCPICKKVVEDAPEDLPTRPFCSPRCKLADLGNWLSDAYRISSPLGPDDLDDDEHKLS